VQLAQARTDLRAEDLSEPAILRGKARLRRPARTQHPGARSFDDDSARSGIAAVSAGRPRCVDIDHTPLSRRANHAASTASSRRAASTATRSISGADRVVLKRRTVSPANS